MRGVVFLGERKLELQDFPDPTPGPGEVVLEIKASGMCGSDLKFYRVKGGAQALGLGGDGSPVIGGHEPCGVVAAVGPGVDPDEAKVGDRVMDHHYLGCGTCPHCLDGWSQLCLEGFVVYGATACTHERCRGWLSLAQPLRPITTQVPSGHRKTEESGHRLAAAKILFPRWLFDSMISAIL